MSKRNWNPTARQKQVLHLLASNGAMTAQAVERSGLGIGATTVHSIFRGTV